MDVRKTASGTNTPEEKQEWCRHNIYRRLNWYRHVMRRDDEHIEKKVLTTDMPGKRKI